MNDRLPAKPQGRPPGSGHLTTGLYVKAPKGLKPRNRSVRNIVAKMRVALPWLEDSDLPAARSWAELEIIGASVFEVLTKIGILTRDGDARRLVNDYRMLKLAQLAYQRELGMTPAARMAIKASGSKASFDLAAAFAAAEDAETTETKG